MNYMISAYQTRPSLDLLVLKQTLKKTDKRRYIYDSKHNNVFEVGKPYHIISKNNNQQ